MESIFTKGVSRAHVDAAFVSLEAALMGHRLSTVDLRYLLDRVRKMALPRLVPNEDSQ